MRIEVKDNGDWVWVTKKGKRYHTRKWSLAWWLEAIIPAIIFILIMSIPATLQAYWGDFPIR